jgi:hypothetical protein
MTKFEIILLAFLGEILYSWAVNCGMAFHQNNVITFDSP